MNQKISRNPDSYRDAKDAKCATKTPNLRLDFVIEYFIPFIQAPYQV